MRISSNKKRLSLDWPKSLSKYKSSIRRNYELSDRTVRDHISSITKSMSRKKKENRPLSLENTKPLLQKKRELSIELLNKTSNSAKVCLKVKRPSKMTILSSKNRKSNLSACSRRKNKSIKKWRGATKKDKYQKIYL
jgi:hypothetical protein